MSKAILVIEMPESCDECDFCGKVREHVNCCKIIRNDQGLCKRIEPDAEEYKKPFWCPLKEVPPYKEFTDCDDSFDDGFKSGYNACIDEILGGGE